MHPRLLLEPDGLGRPPAVALRVLRQDLHLDAGAVGEDAAAALVERDLDRPLPAPLDRDPRERAARELALAQEVAPVDDRPVDALVAGHGVLGLVDRVRPVVAGA